MLEFMVGKRIRLPWLDRPKTLLCRFGAYFLIIGTAVPRLK
jgi:hypothetical protein